jgi:hypothetical protein
LARFMKLNSVKPRSNFGAPLIVQWCSCHVSRVAS